MEIKRLFIVLFTYRSPPRKVDFILLPSKEKCGMRGNLQAKKFISEYSKLFLSTGKSFAFLERAVSRFMQVVKNKQTDYDVVHATRAE
jgi:hypothetical protein